jgi:hypothetical protein
MRKMNVYQPPEKYIDYSLSTSKPFKSHMFYKEKVRTLQTQILKKLKTVAEFLESLYPELTDDFSMNVKVVIEKNLETLRKDLDLLQSGLQKNPYSFHTNKLKINQHHITEMKNVCETLQTVRSYEHESKKLGKIKHALHELEHLIQPTSFESSLLKANVKSKAKPKAANKEPKKKIKEKSTVNPKTKKAISKKAKSTKNLLKPSVKKATKPKPKLPAKHKNLLTSKPKTKIKSSARHKKK